MRPGDESTGGAGHRALTPRTGGWTPGGEAPPGHVAPPTAGRPPPIGAQVVDLRTGAADRSEGESACGRNEGSPPTQKLGVFCYGYPVSRRIFETN